MMADAAENTPYRVALPEFEGPLDLLLHLCKTHEIDIVHIPIAFITEKYLEYLELMQTMPVDLAADYLVMAATLAYLKSRELVPSPEPLEAVGDEEGGEVIDPREELIRRLLEYQKYKDAAEQLGARPIEGRNVFGRGAEIEGGDGQAPLAEHSVWKLIESFGKLLEKAGTKLTHDVVVDRVSISVRINQLIDRIEAGGGSFRFDACFDLALPEAELRNQIVVTLLAILELARLKVVRVLQAPDNDTLFISQISGTSLHEARRAEVTSAHEAAPEGESDSAAQAAAPDSGAAAPTQPAPEASAPIEAPPPEAPPTEEPALAEEPAPAEAFTPAEEPAAPEEALEASAPIAAPAAAEAPVEAEAAASAPPPAEEASPPAPPSEEKNEET
jgi:segregation and condensation protein A